MRSVGEAMAIGRTFPEALQKALRSLENGRAGLNADPAEEAVTAVSDDELAAMVADALAHPGSSRSVRRCAGDGRSIRSPPELRRPLVRRSDRGDLRGPRRDRALPSARRRRAPAGEASRVLRSSARLSLGTRPRRRCARARKAMGLTPHLQDGGHLCCRVRGGDPVPLRDLRRRVRGAAV